MPSWLVFSILASIILTVGLNALLWVFPRAFQSRSQRYLAEMERHVEAGARPRARVVFPWKTMLVVSLLGTVALNLLL